MWFFSILLFTLQPCSLQDPNIQADCMKPRLVNNAAWGIIQLLDFCSLQVFAYDGVYLLAADILLFSPHLLAVATQAPHEPTKIRLTFLLN